MKPLSYYKKYEGQIVKAISANDYTEIKGKCIQVREVISDYTDIEKGIKLFADIENHGAVKVALARTMSVIFLDAEKPSTCVCGDGHNPDCDWRGHHSPENASDVPCADARPSKETGKP